MTESDFVAALLALLVALIIAVAIGYGRGRNRCAVKPRIDDGT